MTKDLLIGGMSSMSTTDCTISLLYKKREVSSLYGSADTAQADKQLAYTLLLAENICQKNDIKVSSSHYN